MRGWFEVKVWIESVIFFLLGLLGVVLGKIEWYLAVVMFLAPWFIYGVEQVSLPETMKNK